MDRLFRLTWQAADLGFDWTHYAEGPGITAIICLNNFRLPNRSRPCCRRI